tara:strand:- start:61 stop:249 length:189 start_codon:yes stop_codon:yes gene_type:complete
MPATTQAVTTLLRALNSMFSPSYFYGLRSLNPSQGECANVSRAIDLRKGIEFKALPLVAPYH